MGQRRFKKQEDAKKFWSKKKKEGERATLSWEGGPRAHRIRYIVTWK